MLWHACSLIVLLELPWLLYSQVTNIEVDCYHIGILQGRHTKTGQLAAIKVMNVTEVSDIRF